jgi:hypothetical protein
LPHPVPARERAGILEAPSAHFHVNPFPCVASSTLGGDLESPNIGLHYLDMCFGCLRAKR